ncbi:hypothetical protein V1264_019266 [Littorina saxatilis]|uniref:Serine palmitoyltransferase small subunit B n=1 Tax=Littorina saxatilis TaxID=31220 RepID=A0AAN9BG89_9CAEN
MLQRLWRHLADTLRHAYFHYSVILCIAILEPAERYVINSVVIVVVSLLVYATVVYMPGHVTMLCQCFVHLTGIRSHGDSVGQRGTTSATIS